MSKTFLTEQPQILTPEQKAQARENIGAVSSADFAAIATIGTTPENVLEISEDNYYNLSPNLSAPTVVFHGDGFDFTKGQDGNYSIAFVFPTEVGKSYDLSFKLESGLMHSGKIANNADYPNAPTYIPSAALVTLATNNGEHKYTFTATGSETMLCIAVRYDSPLFKVSGVSCVLSGSAASATKIKEEALPDSFNNIAANKKAIGERLVFVDDASDFVIASTVVRADGVRVAKNNRPSTDYIELKSCTSISFGLNQCMESATEVYNIVSFYDADKVYISGLRSHGNGYVESVIGVPENAAYVVGSWINSLTDAPYMVGIYDNGLVEKIKATKSIDSLNAEQVDEVVNPTMTLPEFVSAINAQRETYAALCKCKPWSFAPLRDLTSNYKPMPFGELCEVINKNFRAEVASPGFSFAENCNRINNAFKKRIYRFMDAKNETGEVCDYSLTTGLHAGEPSAIVTDDGNTMHIYAYNRRVSTTDGVNWTSEIPTPITGEVQSIIHANVNYIDGVYYMLGTTSNNGGFWLAKSTDGINFTVVRKLFEDGYEFSANDGVTAWGNSYLIKDYGTGTYYLYIEYRGDTSVDWGWKISVVTTDNIESGEWVGNSKNPILTNTWANLDGTNGTAAGNPDFAKSSDNRPVKVDGKYFMYYHSTHDSKSNIIRASSSNLIDWNVDGVVFDNRDTPTAGDDTSGNADHCIVEFKGRTYLFYTWNINQDDSDIWIKYTIDDRPIREVLAIRP